MKSLALSFNVKESPYFHSHPVIDFCVPPKLIPPIMVLDGGEAFGIPSCLDEVMGVEPCDDVEVLIKRRYQRAFST